MTLRLFCALPIPKAVRAELATEQKKWRGSLPTSSIGWTKPDNFHLTLAFLGAVEQSRVAELETELRRRCSGAESLRLVCRGMGCFPNPNRPRVIWAGVEDVNSKGEASALSELQKRVAQACAPFMEHPEQGRFQGHITLGRVKRMERTDSSALLELIGQYRDASFGEWVAPEVELIASDLSQGAPRYSVLSRIALSG